MASRSDPHVTIDPVVLFSILDHAQRRQQGQERVIGTLLGSRSADGLELEIKSSFAVPHNESSEGVEVDMQYHKAMYALHLRTNPREVLVGWYATTSELDAFSALIQNFYSSQGDGTFPHPAVHLTMQADPAKGIAVHTYTSAQVGVTPERIADSCAFVPVQHEVRHQHGLAGLGLDARRAATQARQLKGGASGERAALDAVVGAKDSEARMTALPNDLDSLRNALASTLEMLDRVSKYVEATRNDSNARSDPQNIAVGRFLLDTLNARPSLDAEEIERLFNTQLQDVMMVSYLARTVRDQLDLNAQLQMLSAAP
ncbi:hypothetical protein PYCC9005_001393 [Savitreella phatthalungensis]